MHLQFMTRKIQVFLAIFLLLLSSIAKGQQYRIFIYDNMYGVTDTNAVEAIPPAYDWVRTVAGREAYKIFHPPIGSDAATMKFNMETGSKDFFDRYYSNDIVIQNESYSFAEQKKKQYLINEKTGGTIPLKEDFRSFENVGSRFIVAKFYPKIKAEQPKPAPKKKPAKPVKRGGIPPPPQIERVPPPPPVQDMNMSDYALFHNDTMLKMLLHVKAAFLKPYYFFDESKDSQIDYNANPSGFIAGTGSSQTIYDSLLNPVKKLSLKLNPDKYGGELNHEDQNTLVAACNKQLGQAMVLSFPVYPSAPSNGRNTDDKKPAVAKARLSQQKENDVTRVYLNHAAGNKTLLLETKYKVRVDENDNGVHINPDSKTKTVDFEVNMQTGKLLLPAKYIKLLELKVF